MVRFNRRTLAQRLPFYYGWVILTTAGTSMFVRNAAASLTLAVFVYPISQEMGWSRGLIAGAAGLGGLLASVASPPVGWLCDRYGVRLVLTTGVLILGLSTISLGWATTPLVFYLAYGTGRVVFSSFIQLGASVAVSSWFVRQRGRATGFLFLSHSAGMVLFPIIASLVIQHRGWQDAWIVLGVLVWVVALGPVYLFTIQRPEDVGLKPDGDGAGTADAGGETSLHSAQDEPAWTLREAMGTSSLWLLATATGSLFLVQSGINIHQAAFLIDRGLGVGVASAAISVNAAFTGVGSILWGWVVERLPVRYTFALVALIMAATTALFGTTDSVAEAIIYSAFFGITVAGILVVPTVGYANYFGRRSLGAIRGVTEVFVSVGQAVGAVASGIVFDFTGSYQGAFLGFAILALATISLLVLARPPQKSDVPLM